MTTMNCRKSEPVEESTALGILSVDLDANKKVIRTNEALIGNFICDAVYDYLSKNGHPVDLVIYNSGAFRFDPDKRPTGIYSAGTIYNTDVDEMLPFGDVLTIVELSGQQLYEVFERSAAQLPEAKGPFLQVSLGFQVIIDTMGTAQLINLDETQIVQQGERIVKLKLNEHEIELNNTYTVGMPGFLANGNDGYVSIKNTNDSKKLYLDDVETNAVTDFIIINTPVNVVFSNRIVYQ